MMHTKKARNKLKKKIKITIAFTFTIYYIVPMVHKKIKQKKRGRAFTLSPLQQRESIF